MTPLAHLVVPAATPSGNQMLRRHWAARRKDSADWALLLAAAVGRQAIPRATGPRRLVVTRVGARLLDVDNLAAGAKELVDSVRRRGLIVDDAPQWTTLEFAQRRCAPGERPHTLLDLYELDNRPGEGAQPQEEDRSMAKKKSKTEKKSAADDAPPAPRPKQLRIAGTSSKNEDVEKAVLALYHTRQERAKLGDRAKTQGALLVEAMHRHGLKAYRCEDENLNVILTEKETVSIAPPGEEE